MRRRSAAAPSLLALIVVLTSPSSTEGQDPGQDLLDAGAIERSIVRQIARLRTEEELPGMLVHQEIAALARDHSRAMASGRRPFGHEGFEKRARRLTRSLDAVAVSENVAHNQGHDDPATVVVEGWLESPEHRANLFGDADLTGVGVAIAEDGTVYVTQLYVELAPEPEQEDPAEDDEESTSEPPGS